MMTEEKTLKKNLTFFSFLEKLYSNIYQRGGIVSIEFVKSLLQSRFHDVEELEIIAGDINFYAVGKKTTEPKLSPATIQAVSLA